MKSLKLYKRIKENELKEVVNPRTQDEMIAKAEEIFADKKIALPMLAKLYLESVKLCRNPIYDERANVSIESSAAYLKFDIKFDDGVMSIYVTNTARRSKRDVLIYQCNVDTI